MDLSKKVGEVIICGNSPVLLSSPLPHQMCQTERNISYIVTRHALTRYTPNRKRNTENNNKIIYNIMGCILSICYTSKESEWPTPLLVRNNMNYDTRTQVLFLPLCFRDSHLSFRSWNFR